MGTKVINKADLDMSYSVQLLQKNETILWSYYSWVINAILFNIIKYTVFTNKGILETNKTSPERLILFAARKFYSPIVTGPSTFIAPAPFRYNVVLPGTGLI